MGMGPRNEHPQPAIHRPTRAPVYLAGLSRQPAVLPSGTIALTEQQVESFLDFDPEFLDVAKDMLRVFIEKTEGMGLRGNANGT